MSIIISSSSIQVTLYFCPTYILVNWPEVWRQGSSSRNIDEQFA